MRGFTSRKSGRRGPRDDTKKKKFVPFELQQIGFVPKWRVSSHIYWTKRNALVFDVHGNGIEGNLRLDNGLKHLEYAIRLGQKKRKQYLVIIHGNRRGTIWKNFLRDTYSGSLKKNKNSGVSFLYLKGIRIS